MATESCRNQSAPDESSTPPALVRADARDPSTTADYLQEVLERDGAVIVTHLISREMAEQIRVDLKPHFDADVGDNSGFFPKTTRRAIGLLDISPSCVELALNPLVIKVASSMLTSHFTYWIGQEKHTAVSKPRSPAQSSSRSTQAVDNKACIVMRSTTILQTVIGPA